MPPSELYQESKEIHAAQWLATVDDHLHVS